MLPKDFPHASNEVILRAILDALTSLHDGRFTAHLPEEFPGIGGEIAKVFNAHVAMLTNLRHEHRRLMEEIGVTGRLGGQMEIPGPGGAWKEMVEDVNQMSYHMTEQCRDHGNVVRSLVQGDLDARAPREPQRACGPLPAAQRHRPETHLTSSPLDALTSHCTSSPEIECPHHGLVELAGLAGLVGTREP